MTKPGKCAALDPATCRYHGLILKMNQALRDEDADAYLYYAERAAAREQLANPEEFFVPDNEAEDIASIKQLRDIFHGTESERLPRTYRAEVTYGTQSRGRYRKYARKNKLRFEENRQQDGSQFVFTLNTRHDLFILAEMIAHGQEVLQENDLQGNHVAARSTVTAR